MLNRFTRQAPARLIVASLFLAQASTALAAPLTTQFGQNFLRSLEFIDYPDVLVNIAASNKGTRGGAAQDGFGVWTLYDIGGGGEYTKGCVGHHGCKTPLLQRWNTVQATSFSGPMDVQVMAIHDIFMEEKDPVTMPADLNSPTANDAFWDSVPFRGEPIDDAGGDFDKGKGTDGAPGGYDRVTQAQLAAMRANPLLTVWQPRPDPTSPIPGTVLAQYRYPSAGTYDKFRAMLSPQLLAKLDAAKKANLLSYTSYLTNDGTRMYTVKPEFQRLNKQIIAELLRQAYHAGDTPAANYQRMISVHPFDDYNGRSLRAWYRRVSPKPMFLLNFYCDLYCSPQDFASEINRGMVEYDTIVAKMSKEETTQHLVDAQHPYANDPHVYFYNLPIFWTTASGVAPGVDAPGIPFWANSKASRFVKESVAFWAGDSGVVDRNGVNVPTRVQHKQFDDVIRDFKTYLARPEIQSQFQEVLKK